MRLVIHDLPAEWLVPAPGGDIRVISDDGSIRPCVGCFGCWVKTPGECVIRDGYEGMGAAIGHCDEVILVSHLCYGGFSPFVKNVLDRSISYIHPYFKIRNGEMHHRKRYDHAFNLSVYFYGEGISDREKQVARSLVAANAINLCCNVKEIRFAEDAGEFGGLIL